jgi:hypothetical protein
VRMIVLRDRKREFGRPQRRGEINIDTDDK